MYLTLNAGDPAGHTRFSIYAGNPQTEPILTCPVEEVPLNTWNHIAVTVSPEEYCFYKFPDPYFNGRIDEFYLFDRTLSEKKLLPFTSLVIRII